MIRIGTHVAAMVGAIALIPACEGSSSSSSPSSTLTVELPEASATATKQAEDSQPAKQKRRRRRPPPIKGALPAPRDVAEVPEDAERTESGLASRVLKKGRGGRHPGPNDMVKVHYSGWTTDGHNFDNSIRNGKATEFRLYQVIKGWTEGLQLMTRGEKRRFWIPEELAYKGQPRRPQGMLVFDVELLKITPAPPLPDVPDDVSGPPDSAERSDSGLAWKVLRKGRGSTTPTPASKVKIVFTGWTTDGKLFRSTLLEGRPQEMEVGRISSEGLSEGLQLMTKGEKRRFWIPAELAYKGRFGGPEGMVVMDIEMLAIRN